ncbi:MAG TPA: S41 family peptidase [Ktedonobacterales bacterium]|nr:S41 family peptidase [Ktedonobacterales bacterium]
MSMSPFQNDDPPRPEDAGAWRSAQASQSVLNLVLTSALVVLAFAAGWFGNGFVNRDNLATGDQRLILQAWNTIDQNYIGTVDHRKMAYAAITAMADSLGDTGHTRFETPEEFARESKELQNSQLSGIGVQLTGGGSQPIRINAVIPDSPASKVNIKAGDLIVGVGGTDVRGKTLDLVSPLIQGKAGTPVTLTLIRPSQSATATFDVTIVRGNFSFPAVESYLIPGTTIAHIAVVEFTQDADTQLEKALKDAQAHHVTGIILDLRDNPGGYLDQAQSVASEFIPAGSGKYVLIEKTRQGETKVPVASGGLATTTPLVVLVNGGTASAAEITAGAININRPGVEVIGEKTFGTGTILQTFQLADGSALILGTQEWLLPNGQSVYHKGYEPDQHVTLAAGAIPISPLAAQQQDLTLAQIQQSGDTQLIKGIAVLEGQG